MNQYRMSGVDIYAGNEFAKLIKEKVRAAWPENGNEIGGFAGSGLIPEETKRVTGSVDGTGTVALLAALTKRYENIGQNLVAMCAVDTYVDGARPMYFFDTLGVAHLVIDEHIKIIEGIIRACKIANCKLIGGETAELPDMYKYFWVFNLDGAVIGFRDRELTYMPVRPGQKVYGWLSYGPGSNGFSLLRNVHNLRIKENFWYYIKKAFSAGSDSTGISRIIRILEKPQPELYGKTLADALLVPTPIWISNMDEQRKRGVLFSAHCHITGGGMVDNIPRVIPIDCKVVIDRSAWTRPAIFRYTERIGEIEQREMDRVFNQGIMVVSIVDPQGKLPDDPNVFEIGTVEKRFTDKSGMYSQVQFIGKHCEE